MRVLRQSAAIAAKDLRIDVRGRYSVAAVLPFAATVLLAFGLSLGPGRSTLERSAPAVMWLALLFSSVLAARQAYQLEGEDGALEGLVLAPGDKAAIFLGKASAIAIELVLLASGMWLLVSTLFDVALVRTPHVLVAALVLGTVGLSALGALFGTLTESPRTREAIFPLLLLPLSTPVLVAGIRATELAIAERTSDALQWLGLLVAFDAVFVAAGTLLFGYLLED